jgi:hypothetical protein
MYMTGNLNVDLAPCMLAVGNGGRRCTGIDRCLWITPDVVVIPPPIDGHAVQLRFYLLLP